jgi:hypothetical protein
MSIITSCTAFRLALSIVTEEQCVEATLCIDELDHGALPVECVINRSLDLKNHSS